MSRQLPSFLQILLLASLAIRLTVGAPCCWSANIDRASPAPAKAAHAEMGHSLADINRPAGEHQGHEGGDNRASACCSACGSTLPAAEAPLLASQPAPKSPRRFELQELPRRDLLRLYEATGPPLLI